MTNGSGEWTVSRPTLLLALGVAGGLGLAAVGLLSNSDGAAALRPGVAASVNGAPILQERYEQALAALASDRREPLGPADRAYVLERLIEEELLVQRGLALGLARQDRQIRGELVGAVIEQILADAADEPPDAAQLEAFFEANRPYFAGSPALRVSQVVVAPRSGESETERRGRAREVVRRLRAGERAEDVARERGDAEMAGLPDALLPPGKLRDYLGPEATRRVLALEPGAVSEPVASGRLLRVLRVEERAPGRTPPLDAIREQVSSELRRRAGDRRLREYLAMLRSDADVRVAEAPTAEEPGPPDVAAGEASR